MARPLDTAYNVAFITLFSISLYATVMRDNSEYPLALLHVLWTGAKPLCYLQYV